MSRSLLQTTNQTVQSIEVNGLISPGSVLRRFGCNCQLAGNTVEISGEGYYSVDAVLTVVPTAAGAVTVALYSNGVQVPGAIAYGYASDVSTPVTLPIITTLRQSCKCISADSLTFVLLAGAGNVTNVSARIKKL